VNAFLWLLQGLLAFGFLGAGGLKLVRPKDKLTANPKMRWAARLSPTQLKLLGTAEIVASFALVEPWATGLLPVLTPITAACLAFVMLVAATMRVRRGDSPVLFAALGAMATVVAALRFLSLARGEGA
jgi:hypothetical protein